MVGRRNNNNNNQKIQIKLKGPISIKPNIFWKGNMKYSTADKFRTHSMEHLPLRKALKRSQRPQ
jgi:hypothetical protein